METNEINKVIAEWLGFEKIRGIFNGFGEEYIMYTRNGKTIEYLNFLHDRNQQKWIEDKICEKYDLSYHTIDDDWVVLIEEKKKPPDWEPLAGSRNKSKDQAFIDAIIELIERE